MAIKINENDIIKVSSFAIYNKAKSLYKSNSITKYIAKKSKDYIEIYSKIRDSKFFYLQNITIKESLFWVKL